MFDFGKESLSDADHFVSLDGKPPLRMHHAPLDRKFGIFTSCRTVHRLNKAVRKIERCEVVKVKRLWHHDLEFLSTCLHKL